MSKRKLDIMSKKKRIAALLDMAVNISFCEKGTRSHPDLVLLEEIRRKNNLTPSELKFVFKHSNMLIDANWGDGADTELDNLEFEAAQ